MIGDLGLLLPECAVALGMLAILASDLVVPRPRQPLLAWLGIAACVLGLWLALGAPAGALHGMLSIDAVTALARPAILLAVALVLLAGRTSSGRAETGAWAASVTGLCLGALLVAASDHLLVLWLGLELISLASYSLAAWRGGDRRAAEAGMKYVLFGGSASALMLFGMSHVYGLTGHLDFAGIGAALRSGMPVATAAALCLAGVGIAYKLTIVPFHFYAPDVYQGAPAHTVALVSVVPKIAATAALVRGLGECVPASFVPPAALGGTLAVAAITSLLVASFTALVQRDGKRIVAFSGIGHGGTVLLALACLPGGAPVAAAAFYLVAYAAANLGALFCLAVLEDERGSVSLQALAGSVRRRPWVTAALCLFLGSLAGVPPLAGFLGKWGVLREALDVGLEVPGRAHLAWAALALLVSTAVSAWSYLLIVRAAVLAPPMPGEPAVPPRPAPLAGGTILALAVCAAVTLVAGLWLDGFAAIGRVVAG